MTLSIVDDNYLRCGDAGGWNAYQRNITQGVLQSGRKRGRDSEIVMGSLIDGGD
jgi:hypothetical protein